jgi:hypothetical protein
MAASNFLEASGKRGAPSKKLIAFLFLSSRCPDKRSFSYRDACVFSIDQKANTN